MSTLYSWRDILNHNNAMLATQYPKLQMDETLDIMMTIAATRLYFAIRACTDTDKSKLDSTSSTFPPISLINANSYFKQEKETLRTKLRADGATDVDKYTSQVPNFEFFLKAKKGENSKDVTLRDLVDYVRTHCCVRPRRMIDIEGLPLSAAPRLQYGGEWYGEIDDDGGPIPNFINRLQNCRYLIEITGVRRFVNFENGQEDSAMSDLMGQKIYATEHTQKKVQIFIDEEQRAWNMACAIWSFQEEQLRKIASFLNRMPQNVADLEEWLSNKAAMFRETPLKTKYLPKLFHFSNATKKLVFDQPEPNGFQNIPIVDYTAPDENKVHALLDHCLGTNADRTNPIGRVFMHCAGGWGRTGMGLLLLVMTLGDNGANKNVLEWQEAMQLMYMRYKRQSIAEVKHLLQESINNYDLAVKMSEMSFSSSSEPITLTPDGKDYVVKAPQNKTDFERMKTVKFDVYKEGNPTKFEDGKTVTYHAMMFSQFESFIQKWLEKQGFITSAGVMNPWKSSPYRELCRSSGKPAAPTLIHPPTDKPDSEDHNYAIMKEQISKMKQELEKKTTNVKGGRATRRLRVARKRSLCQPRHPRRRCSRRNRQRGGSIAWRSSRGAIARRGKRSRSSADSRA